jgi:hypothetical protein
MLQERMKENERQRQRTSADIDPEMARYLEDERLALALQNSEFLQELRSNDDFMKTLEKGKVLFCCHCYIMIPNEHAYSHLNVCLFFVCSSHNFCLDLISAIICLNLLNYGPLSKALKINIGIVLTFRYPNGVFKY